jgi:hypothetical protein
VILIPGARQRPWRRCADITVAKVTDVNSLAVEWLQLASSGLGDPSGDLRRDYESAVSKLSSELQKKDWRFSVDNGGRGSSTANRDCDRGNGVSRQAVDANEQHRNR